MAFPAEAAGLPRKFRFGDRGIWKKPASDDHKAADMPCRVLEHTKEGVLYIFTDKPIIRGYRNLAYRTATIFPSDFIPNEHA